MTPRLVLLNAIGVVLMLCAPSARAHNTPCMERAAGLAELKRMYNEEPIGGGGMAGGAQMQILASPDGGTWTIVVLTRDGAVCIAIAGSDLRAIAAPPEGDPL